MPRLRIVTLEGVKLDTEAYEILLPTTEGQIGVFASHAPLVAQAAEGIIRVRYKQGDPDDFMEALTCHGGVIEITDEVVKLLADEAKISTELTEAAEKAAYERALEMRAAAKDQVSLDKAQAMIDRQAVRLQVAKFKRRHR
jgi:F-type H+-transporting ATPase subunit epsilon